VRILVPSLVASIALGTVTGYAMAFHRVRGGNWLFAIMLIGAFIPYQVFIYPMVRVFSLIGLYDSLAGIVVVHVIFGLPLMTLLFRNYYSSLPIELFNAARVDGAGFVTIFRHVILSMSTPIIIVATILQVTGVWNDFILGLTFAGRDNRPMTVLLNNIVNSTMGEAAYNVDMAATIITALVPLAVYFVSGRWFVRGIAAGAVKG
jgi:glucose/mannose transport system permease protein